MRNVTLNNGVQMPILGLGVYRVQDPAVCERSVLDENKGVYFSYDDPEVVKQFRDFGK